MVNIDNIIAYEQGDLNYDDTVKMFQEMINDGTVWSLQGSYGRTAAALIEKGICTHSEKSNKDFYGNKLPTKNGKDVDKRNGK